MTDCQKGLVDIRSIHRLGLDAASGEEPAPPRPARRALLLGARAVAWIYGILHRYFDCDEFEHLHAS
jgi:hypothetical protein